MRRIGRITVRIIAGFCTLLVALIIVGLLLPGDTGRNEERIGFVLGEVLAYVIIAGVVVGAVWGLALLLARRIVRRRQADAPPASDSAPSVGSGVQQ